jgi:hypothetical protein
MFYHHWTDIEIAQMLLLVDPDISHIEIETKFPDTPFVFTTKEGASFTGVVTAFREHAVELRQADGKRVYVLKSAVAAVSRP